MTERKLQGQLSYPHLEGRVIHRLNSNACALTQEENWKSIHSQPAVMRLKTQRLGRIVYRSDQIAHMIGEWSWMGTT